MKLVLISLIFVTLFSCDIIRPGGDVPLPDMKGVQKSFFAQTGNSKTRVGNTDRKVFIGSWASVTTVGWFGEVSQYDNMVKNYHTNIIFEVEENQLLGKMINPSYPDDSTKWETVVTIPITKHYYYELKKDQYNRETTDYIENSSRSHWSARPYMKLNFAGTKVDKWAYALNDSYDGVKVMAVEDIEWDESGEFFAFTLVTSSTSFGADRQSKFRFNFMAIDPGGTPGFKITKYHEDNAKLFNVLHIMGKRIDGINPEYVAAHWDLSNRIDFYMYDFPERFQDIALDSLEVWNDEFEKMGFGRPFVAKFENNPRYYFDLRKPSMTWMGDRRVSRNSPLGVGMAQANIFTGEIVWGGVMIWGGIIEDYIKAYAPLGVEGGANGHGSFLGNGYDSFYIFDQQTLNTFNAGLERAVAPKKLTFQQFSGLNEMLGMGLSKEDQELIGPRIEKMNQRYQSAIKTQENFSFPFPEFLKKPDEASIRKYLGIPATQTLSDNPQELFTANTLYGVNGKSSFDNDVTLSSISSQLGNAIARMKENGKTFSPEEAMRVFLKDLIIHELGHLIGLGHNFKENILPEEGSVPDKYYSKLKDDFESGYKNYTSVMGYRNPLTVLDSTYNEIHAGPHDTLLLRYLYKQEYATYEPGDDDFTFKKIAGDGRVDTSDNLSYFPACNDLEASYYRDPYCNRHARGGDAESIIQSHFDSLDYVTGRIHAAFTEFRRRHDPKSLERSLWAYAVNHYSRIRLFYDYMRLKYKDEIMSLKGDESNLLYFSTCTDEDELAKHSKLAAIFDNNPELKSLCKANLQAINKMGKYLELGGGDYSEVDRSEKVIPGGITAGDARPGFDRWTGSWTSITPFYLKLATLYALTENHPHMVIGPFMMANWDYSTYEDGGYSYFTLYPFEMTKTIATSVANNIQLLDEENDKSAELSLLNWHMGWMLYNAKSNNNDQNFFVNQSSYFDRLFRQHQFFGEYAYILLYPNKIGTSDEKIHSFHAEIYRQFGNTPLGSAYMLPNRKLVFDSGDKMVIQLGDVEFVRNIVADKNNPKNGVINYVPAIIVSYSDEFDDKLAGESTKERLTQIYANEMRKCLRNGKNGLSEFFNADLKEEEFQGFEFPPSMGSSVTIEKQYYESVEEGFKRYEDLTGQKLEICNNAVINLEMITNAALLINGGFTASALRFINKNR